MSNYNNNIKEAFKHQWTLSSKKELFIHDYITQNTINLTPTFIGLGAGTDEYIDHKDQPADHVKGTADIFIPQTNTYIEITGPNVQVHENDSIWINSIKLNNSYTKLKQDPTSSHIVVHFNTNFKNITTIRIVPINKTFFDNAHKYKIIKPKISNINFKFIALNPNTFPVLPFSSLIPSIIKNNISAYTKLLP